MRAWIARSRKPDPLFFLLLVAVLTIIYSPLALRPNYQPEVGEVSARNIKADRELLLEDYIATAQRRQQAFHSVRPVFDWDPGMAEMLANRFQGALVALEKLARAADADESRESVRAKFNQGRDRPISLAAFNALMEMGGLMRELTPGETAKVPDQPPQSVGADAVLATALNPGFATLRQRLLNWLKPLARQKIVSGPETIKDVQRHESVAIPLDGGPEEKLVAGEGVIDLQAFREQLARSANEHFNDMPGALRKWILTEAQSLARPNLNANLAETKNRRKQAVEAVEPVYLSVRRGQMVLREGELVTEDAYRKVQALNAERWNVGLLLRIGGLALALAMFLWLGRSFLLRTSPKFPHDKKTVYLLGGLLAITALAGAVSHAVGQGVAGLFLWNERMINYMPPVALGAAMASLMVGARSGLPGGALVVGTALSFLTALASEGGLPLFLYFLIGSLVGGTCLRSSRHRFDVLRAGATIGFAQMAAIPAVEALAGHAPSLDWLLGMGMALVSGLLVGLLALALIPLFESLFRVATDSRLMELASGDHPLLKQLSLRTPGTYHHSVMMGNLAEAAAESIGANPLLARVMALYHDVGKMSKPQYFVENQSGENRHDHLAPSMSAKIIMGHVKDGVELARQYKLGDHIIEAITTHQGNTVLQFFYNKALNEASKRGDNVSPEDYRYPGPLPQSREAGILMIADSVEAAARTLKNPAPAQIAALVKRLIDSKIADGQLDDCHLTLRELAQVEDAFVRVLTLGFYHRRIAYPDQVKKVPSTAEESRNGANAGKPRPSSMAA
ncbi:putative metal dependent phosphohydrolase [Magnetofaba australis IT-1]|uniref:Putative metal dependent phosphohydrolase n=1 Tax=Magnetofaba australis IT-1 TaxID=1434232 RepID=A0A1Y2K547_9PROT|nr:putative metal dependent phosphohydrolase [Magnetofaba australis IT-1]